MTQQEQKAGMFVIGFGSCFLLLFILAMMLTPNQKEMSTQPLAAPVQQSDRPAEAVREK